MDSTNLTDGQRAAAALRSELADVERDLARLAQLRAVDLSDVEPRDLRQHLNELRTLEDQAPVLRTMRKTLEKRLRGIDQANAFEAKRLAREAAQAAGKAHADALRAGLQAALAPLDALAGDPLARGSGVGAHLVGLRRQILSALELIDKYW